MARKEILELDEKGILPFDYEDEEQFIRRAGALFEAYNKHGRDGLAKKIESILPQIKVFQDQPRESYEYALNHIKARYKTNPDFCPVFYANLPSPIAGMSTLRHYSGQGIYDLPQIILVSTPQWGVNVRSTLKHELIHTIRMPIAHQRDIFYSGQKDFEEDFADEGFSLFGSRHARCLRKAKKRLAKELGDNWGYTLIRLSYGEILENIIEMESGSKTIEHLKRCSPNYLRYRVILEKLGL